MKMPVTWPDTFDFQGFNEPVRLEWAADDLPVEGDIPPEIDGSFFRAIADPARVPFVERDTMLSGDGMVSRFRIRGNDVDFAIRYVKTARYAAEERARRALFGAYRNPFTDDPSVAGIDRTVANTTPVWHAGRLLMTKEDGRPYRIDPLTLETLGSWDFEGKLRSQTVTAHVRVDAQTGEMFFFGYEAGGLCTRDIAYCIADRKGRLASEQWFEAPYCSMVHDFVISERYAIFPIFPTTSSLERVKAGGAHWIHEPQRPSWVGIMPRYGDVSELRWFEGPPGISAYHMMNAFDDGPRVHVDLSVQTTNVFPFIRTPSGIEVEPQDVHSALTRWTFDMESPRRDFEQRVIGPSGDMPRIAARDQGRPYRIGYYAAYDPVIGPPNTHGPVGGGFNALLRIEVESGRVEKLPLRPDQSISEPVHIPARTARHEGWLACVVDTHSSMSSELWVLDAERITRGPLASVRLPVRLKPQIHGWWVGAEELAGAAAR